MISFISMSVIMSPFLFLILLIWTLSLCLLVNLDMGLLILPNFSKKTNFCFIDSLYSSACFYFIDFSSLIISCQFLLLGVLFVLELSDVLLISQYEIFLVFVYPLSTMYFPLSTAFIMSHKFVYVVYSFSLNSRKSFFFIFVLTHFHSVEIFFLFP